LNPWPRSFGRRGFEMGRDFASMGRAAWDKHPERRNPIKQCVLCLYRVGYGYTTIAKLTDTNKSVARKWVLREGIERAERKVGRGFVTASARDRLTARRREKVRRKELEWEISQQIKIHFTQPPAKPPPLERVEAMRQKALESYHKHKGANLVRTRERARITWDKKKSDPVWRAKRRADHKRWIKSNPGYSTVWQKNNPEKFRESARKHRRQPHVKAVRNICQRVREFLNEGLRAKSTAELIGCTRAHLRSHIERQFVGRMSWENYGRSWHIDHIIPLAKHDRNNPAELKRASHWTNLRPLWKRANLDKSDKLENAQLGLALTLTA
jgi:hypothetical protein